MRQYCSLFVVLHTLHTTRASLCPSCHPATDEGRLSAFEESLQVLINRHLGMRVTQGQFTANNDRIEIRQETVDLQRTISLIATELAMTIYERRAMLASIEQQLQRMAQTQSSDRVKYEMCCNVTGTTRGDNSAHLQYSSVYKTRVDTNSICMYNTDEYHVSAVNVTRELLDTFQSNSRQYPVAGWQHVYVVGAGYYLYPKVRTVSCDMEKIRHRPWYAKIIMPLVNIVILVDCSLPMVNSSISGHSLLRVAKDLAVGIIDRHSVHAKIAVVAFSNHTICPGADDSCYASECVFATPFNKAILRNFVNEVVADERVLQPSYITGLVKARALLRNSDSPNPVIVWLTTGQPPNDTTEDVLRGINETIAEFPGIHIVTFDIGAQSDENGSVLLRDMAKSPSDTVRPLHVSVEHVRNNQLILFPLYYYMSSFVQAAALHVSTPYHNRNSNDTIWTVSLPVIYRNKLIAVAGVDVFLSEVLHKLNFFKHTHTQYFFIMHILENYTMAHPHLSLPKHEQQIVYVNIKHLEKDAYREGIIDAMINKTDGSKIIDVVRNIPRGDTYREGYRTVTTRTAYIWKSFPTLPFACAFVTTNLDYLTFKSKTSDAVPFGNIQYKKKVGLCRHFGQTSIADYTTLHWSPSTFIHPIKRMATNETLTVLKKYHKILSKKLNNSVFVDGVVDSAQVLRVAHDHWTRNKYSSFALRRYLAFASGIMIVFPGEWRDRSSNPLAKGWYKNAALFPGSTAVSMPYLDPQGAGDIVTISKTVVVEGTALQAGSVIGVMGIDVTMSYLRARLRERFTKCKQASITCFLVDTAGYIIIHEDMFLPPRQAPPPRIHNVHITSVEPHIANDLLNTGVMKRVSCFNLLKMHKHYMYSIDAQSLINKFDVYPYYDLGHVPNSNIFVVIKNKDGRITTDVDCVCRSLDKSIPVCIDNNPCQCPCVKKEGNFNHCEHAIDGNWTSCEDDEAYSLHFPSTLQYESDEQKIAELSALAPCYSYDCEKQKTREKCDLLSGCKWCMTDINGKDMTHAYCGEYFTCFYGQVGYPSPYGYEIPHWEEDACDTRCIIIRVVSTIAVAASVLLLGVLVYNVIVKLRGINTMVAKIKYAQRTDEGDSNSVNSFESLGSQPDDNDDEKLQASRPDISILDVIEWQNRSSKRPSLIVSIDKGIESLHSERSSRRKSRAETAIVDF